jgi:hypothetical protein
MKPKRKPSEHPKGWWHGDKPARAASLAWLIIAVLRVVDWWHEHFGC